MDLTSRSVIRSIQDKFGFTFKKGLGQNFLTSAKVLEEITEAAEIDGGVIEIGPGFGSLTAALAAKAEKVISIELDHKLLPVLQYTLSEFDNIKIINDDVLKIDLNELIEQEFGGNKISIAANLPYYITTPVITRLLESRLPVKNIVVMVQKEVAQRLAATYGNKNYGAVTVLCRYFTEPEIITTVPASLFVPPPKVDSAVLRLKILDKPSVKTDDEKVFFRVVKAAFSQRRKTLLNCLCANFPIAKQDMSELLLRLGIEPSRRGETLSLEEFALIADNIIK